MSRFWQLFSWWHGTTIGTSFTIWKRGEYVGTDELGNRYFRSRKGRKDPTLGFERRWVVYPRLAEASLIPPGWHAWIHHRVETPPSQEDYRPRDWQKAHRPNMTGTPEAYHPPGSLLRPDPDSAFDTGYDAWTPFGEPASPPNVSPTDTRDGA